MSLAFDFIRRQASHENPPYSIRFWFRYAGVMHTIIEKIDRFLIVKAVFFLPQEQKIRIERWLRGKEEFRKLQQADAVIVSYGKSGRTWLRVLLSRFYQLQYGLSEHQLIGFDNLHRNNGYIPQLFFTHANYIKDYTNNRHSQADFYTSKVVLLVRNPLDVAVSQFFQWKYRMRAGKKALNKYPAHGSDMSIFDFVISPEQIDQIIAAYAALPCNACSLTS